MKAFIRLYVSCLIWIILAVGGLHITADCSRAQHDIFDANVVEKWKAYEDFSCKLQGTARSQTTRDGKLQESIKHYKQNRECALLIVPHNRDPLSSMCMLANRHYSATISLSKSDAKNAVLQKYTPLSSNTENFTPNEVVFFETSRHFAYSRLSRLRQAVLDPQFQVTKVANEIQDGQELIHIDYIYNYGSRANPDIHVRTHGSLWLDPSRCWCIRRLKSSDEATARGEKRSATEEELVCETVDHPSGFPILKSRTERFKLFDYRNKRKTDATSKIDYEWEISDRVPDSEFTLSAFGLPEPGGEAPVKKPTPLYVWILAAAAACAVLALGFRYLVRRGQLRPTA